MYFFSCGNSVVDPNTKNIKFGSGILNFGPIWIRIEGYDIKFEKNVKNSSAGKQFFL